MITGVVLTTDVGTDLSGNLIDASGSGWSALVYPNYVDIKMIPANSILSFVCTPIVDTNVDNVGSGINQVSVSFTGGKGIFVQVPPVDPPVVRVATGVSSQMVGVSFMAFVKLT
jgi:hypothetical protein